jgi:hypothetical protein
VTARRAATASARGDEDEGHERSERDHRAGEPHSAPRRIISGREHPDKESTIP